MATVDNVLQFDLLSKTIWYFFHDRIQILHWTILALTRFETKYISPSSDTECCIPNIHWADESCYYCAHTHGGLHCSCAEHGFSWCSPMECWCTTGRSKFIPLMLDQNARFIRPNYIHTIIVWQWFGIYIV